MSLKCFFKSLDLFLVQNTVVPERDTESFQNMIYLEPSMCTMASTHCSWVEIHYRPLNVYVFGSMGTSI
jgi:hypothetical protein